MLSCFEYFCNCFLKKKEERVLLEEVVVEEYCPELREVVVE
jgi:hypothetical protein